MIDFIGSVVLFVTGVYLLILWIINDPADDGIVPPYPRVIVPERTMRMKTAWHIDPLLARMYGTRDE